MFKKWLLKSYTLTSATAGRESSPRYRVRAPVQSVRDTRTRLDELSFINIILHSLIQDRCQQIDKKAQARSLLASNTRGRFPGQVGFAG